MPGFIAWCTQHLDIFVQANSHDPHNGRSNQVSREGYEKE